MTAHIDAIIATGYDLEIDTINAHLKRTDEEYLARFSADAIAGHIAHLQKLDNQNLVERLIETIDDGLVQCTVIAFDYPFEFSLLTGILSGNGFDITSGDVFTLPKVTSPQPQQPARQTTIQSLRNRRLFAAKPERNPMANSVIIDRFVGRLTTDENLDAWSLRVSEIIKQVITLLDRGDEKSVARAKKIVNEQVTEQLARQPSVRAPAMSPVSIEIEQLPRATRLKIMAQDTAAFLYSFATAISLHNLYIDRVRIRGEASRIADVIDVVGHDEKPITDPDILERVKLSVLLTKQFTYFLSESPDPYKALTRFETLAENITRLPQSSQWTEALADPQAMNELAKLLGTSDFLWEDFIRQQYESLLPIFVPHLEGKRFTEPRETVPIRLKQTLDSGKTIDDKRTLLNQFKDRETFLIDLDHILTPGSDFRQLSERLTWLAENLIAAAADIVYHNLIDTFGQPKNEQGDNAHYAVLALGKLGGVALGYASDIELLFIYSAQGQTEGGKRKSIDNATFFQQLAQQTAQFIQAKREGIFQVDLRLRPYGKDSPLASSLKHFHSYYGPDGPAHPFERLALVRLRWIAGHSKLGFEIEQLRDQFVYDNPNPETDLNLQQIWEITTKQRQQKLLQNPGSLNAKYSPGALADLETTVQLLQVTHARQVPQLRAPRLSVVLNGLKRGGILAADEFAELVGSYHFLRKLINALRMLRGNAQDLFLPPFDSDELNHLAKRIGYEPTTNQSPAQQLIDQFNTHTQIVQAFTCKHFSQS